VAFCGDGANDAGALRAALVGLSLCQADASVAAPLTSRRASVAAMATVIKEGRCALAAAYSIFRFIMSYALVQVGCAACRPAGCRPRRQYGTHHRLHSPHSSLAGRAQDPAVSGQGLKDGPTSRMSLRRA
jgi:hypothetical protein